MENELKENKCKVAFPCSANPFNYKECVYADGVRRDHGHKRCKYWNYRGKRCTSLVAAVNAMTVLLKDMTT